jgi:hypothetical protein
MGILTCLRCLSRVCLLPTRELTSFMYLWYNYLFWNFRTQQSNSIQKYSFLNIGIFLQFVTIMCTLSAKMEHCPIVVKLLRILLGGHWRRFDQPTTGVRETYPLEQNAYFVVNLAGVPNAWLAGNVNGVDWR